MLLVGGGSALHAGQGLLTDPVHILVVVHQQVFQHLGVAGAVEDVVELAVQVDHLLQMSLAGVVFSQIDILLHGLHLFPGDVFGRPAGAEALQPCPYHVDILDILGLDSGHEGAAVGNNLHQSLQLQLPESLADRCPGDTQLLADPDLLELLVLLVPAIQNIISDLGKNTSPQRIFVCYLTL